MRRMLPGLFVLILVLGFLSAGSLLASTQTNVSKTYPFVKDQSVIGLDYRTPFAQIRDYLMAHPQANYTIIGEDPLSLDGNVSNIWHFTPGTSGLHVTWDSYNNVIGPGDFVYMPPDLGTTHLIVKGTCDPDAIFNASFLFVHCRIYSKIV